MTARYHRRLRATGLALGLLALTACRREPPPDAVGRAIAATTLGSVYLQEGRLAEAEAEFRQVIDLLPRAASGYANLALVFLRAGRYDEAEAFLRRALERDTTEASSYLLLAKIYELTDRRDEARRELERLVARDSTDPRVAYTLAEFLTAEDSTSDPALALLARVSMMAPGNLAARLRLAVGLATRGLADSAIGQLEALRALIAQPSPRTGRDLDETIRLLRAGAATDALVPLARVERALELTPEFQGNLRAVQGPGVGGVLEGFPTLSYSPILQLPGREQIVRDAVVFRDTDAGLSAITEFVPTIAVGDHDGDGVDDLLAGPTLFRNTGGSYAPVGGPPVMTGSPHTAAFADADNDGRIDLYVGGPAGRHLFLRSADGGSRDVAASWRLGESGAGEHRAIFVDLDHDGDLDLFLATDGLDQVFRNNLDGTATSVAGPSGLAGTNAPTRGVAFGDFNDDGRIDLAVVGAEANHRLYLNRGEFRFEDMAASSGFAPGAARAVVAADVDADGDLDLVVAGETAGDIRLYLNRGDATFERAALGVAGSSLASLAPRDIAALDYDNDGDLDFLAVGHPTGPAASGLVLLSNDGTGRLRERVDALPPRLPATDQVLVADYDLDGDEDVILRDQTGVRLLRNDGGNAHLYVKVRLTGLRTGSGKNNPFGVGARVEVRAGDLYQTRVATGRELHFGLAGHRTADVIRVTWPNGVPQVLSPGSSGEIIEQDVLKGSCAFAYFWNGEQYVFVTDVMWRSAIGMPLGIMGGTTRYAPPAASTEYLRIAGEFLAPRDGRYSLQLTEELWETAYVDEVKLIVVDHPDSVEVFVNERFVPPGPTELRLFPTRAQRSPVSARDGDGRDVLADLLERDDRYVSSLSPGRYQGITRPNELILDLGPFASGDSVFLFLNGWIFPSDASINVAVAQSSAVQVQWPALDIMDAAGRWQPAIPDLGFPSGKAKTVIADLTGRFPTADHRVRIRSTMQIYWDHAFVGASAAASPSRMTTLPPLSADLHRRGFSRTFRRGGRYGPHWFDYGDVSTDERWRPITGSFTRYGDVTTLLEDPDDLSVVMAPGDETTIEFDAGRVPPLPPGWRRDFLLYTVGWIKDSDLNTATGTTVDPLPFHAMREYPYGASERFPDDAAHREYLQTYQTRRRGPGKR